MLRVTRRRATYQATHRAGGDARSASAATLSFVAAGVIAAAFVVAAFVVAIASDSPATVDTADRNPASQDAASQDAADRAAAEQRADRSRRITPSVGPSSTTPAPAPAVAAAPAVVAAPTVVPAPAAVATVAPKPDWVSPMPGVPLSSCYGLRWGTVHQGIDFAGDAGTAIRAVGAGTVVSAGWMYTGYGISVVIDHGNGFLSHYAHAEQALVTVGQRVTPGQTIALEGSTGDATGPHLHFEIHQGMWNQIDPAPWLRARGVTVGC